MSDSLVDRILVGPSIDGNGPLTRSLHETHTSGFIHHDAPHWSIESYIPISVGTLVEYLIDRGELSPGHRLPFRRCCQELDRILHESTTTYHSHFADVYAALDPDADHHVPRRHQAGSVGHPPATAASSQHDPESPQVAGDADPPVDRQLSEVMQLCETIFLDAGFRHMETDEVARCVGVASQFGVPLRVDLGIFQRLRVYSRGDVIGTRFRRRLRNLYRRETVEVQVYQRMLVLFQLRDDDTSDEQLTASAVHLRMFKNVPKQDINTLLPGARVRITGIDSVKIIVPSLGGFLMSMKRVAQYVMLFAAITLHWSAILVVLLIGYLMKSLFGYFHTKNRYQLNLTRNLYFQKLDTNSGVGYHVIQLAHQQRLLEAILAQYAILTSDEPISTRRLRRKCERLLREAIRVEVDFQVDRALEVLVKLGAVRPANEAWKADPYRFP